MRSPVTCLTVISILLFNVSTSSAGNRHPKQQKSRVERKASTTSTRGKQVREKRERREAATRRALIKRNPRYASLFKQDSDIDAERTDQPREALEWYLQKRLPKGEKQLPIGRYFQAKEKIKRMKRFSTARNKNLPPQTDTTERLAITATPAPTTLSAGLTATTLATTSLLSTTTLATATASLFAAAAAAALAFVTLILFPVCHCLPSLIY